MNTMQKLAKAMQSPDRFVIRMRYTDKHGVCTERVVSPIKFIGQSIVEAMCLCRESVRTFRVEMCEEVQVVPAHEVQMPEPITVVGERNEKG